MKPLYLCSVKFGPVKCIPETKNKDFLPTKQVPTSTIFPSKLHLSQFVVSVTASYPVCLKVHCKKTMIVVHLKFWIIILKVLLLNLEYKWEQFNNFHFSSKMKHMWNPDCDLAD